jgi:hypothetical protein
VPKAQNEISSSTNAFSQKQVHNRSSETQIKTREEGQTKLYTPKYI